MKLHASEFSWDCASCKKQNLCGERGCLPGTKARVVLKTGAVFPYCPIRWVREDCGREFLLEQDVLRFRAHKILPVSGGMLDQDCLFVEALDIVDNEIARIEKRESKKNARRPNPAY